MKRKWIVRLRLVRDTAFAAAHDLDTGARFKQAVDDLRARVEGELAFAMVPDVTLSRVWERLDPGLPLHLVIPGETVPAEEGVEGKWEFLDENAVSTNVQSGRAKTKSDWEDCAVWLGSVAEIDLILHASATKRPAHDGPTLLFPLDGGRAKFVGFRSDKPISDEAFEQMVEDVFGSGPEPADLGVISTQAGVVADRCAPWFRFLESGSLFLNISPGIILTLGGIFLWMPETKAVWKLGAAFLATLAALGLKRVHSRRRWLSARALAEICRSLHHSGDILDPLFPPAAVHLPRHAALVRSLAVARAETTSEFEFDAVTLRDHYLKERLAGTEGQIPYYGRQAKKACRRRKWVKGVFQTATLLALVSTGFAVASFTGLLPGTEGFNDRWVAGVATYALPALAAAAIGYLGISETTRRAEYFAEMASMLERQRDILEKLQSRSSIKEAIRKTESLLLEEFSGWLRRRVY